MSLAPGNIEWVDPAPVVHSTKRLYEVRLDGLHTVFVLATDHVTAISLAMISRPIKPDASVAVSVVSNFLMAPTRLPVVHHD